MPKAMELALKKRARKMGLSKKRTGAYVYGTMLKTGWRPKKWGKATVPLTAKSGKRNW